MARAPNFGDPSFEPTDDELAALIGEAFADVPARRAAALARVRHDIAERRAAIAPPESGGSGGNRGSDGSGSSGGAT